MRPRQPSPERVRVKAPADLRNCTGKTQGHLFRVGEAFLMQLHRSRPEPRLSTFERCWLSGATGLAQRTGDTRDLFALRSPGSVSPLCPTCAPVKANSAARKARERDKRATETRLRGCPSCTLIEPCAGPLNRPFNESWRASGPSLPRLAEERVAGLPSRGDCLKSDINSAGSGPAALFVHGVVPSTCWSWRGRFARRSV